MKKTLAGVILLLALSSLAGGCGKEAENLVEAPAENPEEESVEEELPEVQAWEEEQGFSFADVADREFYFSSGVGGWYTVLCIHEDGSFDGYFRDSNMGETGEGYPNGTLYYSEFSGSFTEPERVDDWSYRFQIEEIEYPLGFGEEIKDGILYCYATAYGLDGAEDLYLYLPGKRTAELPEEYLSWISYYDPESAENEELPFYGLYNEKQQEGFSSYISEQEEEIPEWSLQIKETVLAAEKENDRIESRLQGDDMVSQQELNQITWEVYQNWDNALNTVWEIMKDNKDETFMEELTEKERYWIRRKEECIQEAGAPFGEGSARPMEENSEAAKLTRYRVYELAAEAGAPMETQLIYDGRYFDEDIYLYWTGEIEDASSLTYCEIQIYNVTDTSFDFTVNELDAETDESTELLTGTAFIRYNGKEAFYEGEDFSFLFQFQTDPEVFPKYLSVEGWDKLAGKSFMNKDIPGHESG